MGLVGAIGYPGPVSETDTDLDPRAELAGLARGLRGHLELDRLFGVPCLPVPHLAPLRTIEAPVARPATPAPVVRQTPVASAPAPAVAPAPAPAPTADDPALTARRAANEPRLEALARRMAGCTKCRLAEGRKNLVFGQGDAAAEVVFVGEGPGYHEDQQGLAFVGPAGQLLTKMITAMGLTRDQVFIANVVKCRPPDNRTPAPDEMATCRPFLEEQLDIIQPRVICAMGKTAAQGLGLIGPDEPLGRSRGKFKTWRGIPTMVTYHPAYLLRNPDDKRKTWEDLRQLFPYIARRSST
jgi:uracil-DNA glycosylase family 4